MGIPDHLTYLLRNLYVGQEAIVRILHRTADWFQIGKGVPQGHILSPCLFNFYAELQQYVNQELADVQAGFRKGKGTRDPIANIPWIIEKAREFQKNIYFCFIDYVKVFDCVDHNKLWKIIKETGISDHLTCLL